MCVRGGGLARAGDLADDAVFKHDVGDGFGCATAIDESGIADDGLHWLFIFAHSSIVAFQSVYLTFHISF